MSITIITPTGDRPEAFELTRKWVISQTVQPDQWLVIDDGKEPLPDYLRIDVDYVRREPKENEGHTLILNMKEAVKHIKGDTILIFEDDDWYGPDYVKTMVHYLGIYDLVGESYARYYHLPAMKYRRIGNNAHASFCQTGFNKRLLSVFNTCLEGDPYIDARFWSIVTEHKYLIVDTADQLHLHCSLKGMKGRLGIGSGHNKEARYYNVDDSLEYLIRWVGEENAKIYMQHVGQSFISAKLVGIDKRGRKIPVAVKRAPPVPEVKKENITVITCTGDRPETFALLNQWMDNQIVKPDQWIVIDDGVVPMKVTRKYEYYRRNPTVQDYTHTLCLNLLLAFKYVKCDKIIIMEDDDWYHPTYIDYMNKLLDKADLVGLGNLIFYYPSTGSYMEKKTIKQPAFAQTAFHANIIPVIKGICEIAPKDFELCGKGLVDTHLWKNPLNINKSKVSVVLTTNLKTMTGKVLPVGSVFTDPIPEGILRKARINQGAMFVNKNVPIEGKKLIVNSDKYISIGMKGLPGRKGLTTHHNIDNKKYKKDVDRALLKSILKNDSEYYGKFIS